MNIFDTKGNTKTLEYFTNSQLSICLASFCLDETNVNLLFYDKRKKTCRNFFTER